MTTSNTVQLDHIQYDNADSQSPSLCMPSPHTVHCPACGSTISPNDINHHLDNSCPTLNPLQKPSPKSSLPITPSSAGKKQTKLFATPSGTLSRQSSFSSPTPQGQKRKLSEEQQADNLEPARKQPRKGGKEGHVPLAELARPKTLEEFCGQSNLVGEGKLLRSLVEQNRVPSLIFWGPPGVGKTTLARIIAKTQNTFYRELSATIHSLSDVRKAAEECKNHKVLTNQKPIIFLDEIHRFTKTQQDFFLSPIEQGHFTFIAATTENPSFRCNNALLSRCRVFVLEKLDENDLVPLLRRALGIKIGNTVGGANEGVVEGEKGVKISESVLKHLAQLADGDARVALNALEMTVDVAVGSGKGDVTEEMMRESFQRSTLIYDKDGEEHYNIISALHKSLRGSDANAALYWLGRMLYAGEDPLYIARRLIRFASEDIGVADNSALSMALATYQSCQVVGMPECDVILGHCVTVLARCKKGVEVYRAMKRVKETVDKEGALPVPLHIRNAPTKLMKDLNYGAGYKYNPDYDEPVEQEYLPRALKNRQFFDGEGVDSDASQGSEGVLGV